MPSILGAMILLFGNAFGAQATAYQLTGGSSTSSPLVIGNQISGDVLHNPGLGYAMAMGMVVIMAISILVYTLLQRRSERWLAMTDGGANRHRSTGIDADAARVARRTGRAPRAHGRRGVGRLWAWLVFILGALYFFLPLLGDVRVLAPGAAVRARPTPRCLADPQFFVEPALFVRRRRHHDRRQHSLLIVPTAFWVRLRLPRLRPVVEFVTLLPFVIPPVVLVFGLIAPTAGRRCR